MGAPAVGALAAALWGGCLLATPWLRATLGLATGAPGSTVTMALLLGGLAGLAAAALLSSRRPLAGLLLASVALGLFGAGLTSARLELAERGPVPATPEAAPTVATLTGQVVSEARPTVRGGWVLIRVDRLGQAPARQRVALALSDVTTAPAVGERVETAARLSPLHLDGFDGYLRAHGAVARAEPYGAVRVTEPAPALLAASTGVRLRTREAFEAAFDPARAALLTGVTTGDLSARPDGQQEQFAGAGLSHLVVVSGKHTALMLAGVLGLAGLCGLGPRGRAAVAAAALVWFVILVRWQPSVLRAAATAAVVLAVGLAGRARLPTRLLGVVVLLLLLSDPLLASRLGFVLSVLATAGVLIIGPWVVGRLAGPAWLRWTVGATVGAQVGVTPILLATDAGLPPGALPANLVAGPAAALAQTVGLLAAVLAQVSPQAAAVLAGLAGPALSAILWAADTFSELPTLTAADLLSPAAGLLGLAFLLRRRRWLALGLLAAACSVVLWPLLAPEAPLDAPTVTTLDVGQGDAVLIEVPAAAGRARLLIDGGGEPALLARRLRERGVRRLDVVVLTHGHADHGAGLAGALGRQRVGLLLVGVRPDPADVPLTSATVTLAGDAGVPVRAVAAGERFMLGDAEVNVLSPPLRGLATDDLNDLSVVLRIDTPQGSVLTAGDAGQAPQRLLLSRRVDLDVDVLVVPHHGAAGNADGFLAATAARVALVSAGAENPYGHPAPSTMSELAAMDARAALTARDGTVTVVLGPEGPTFAAPRRLGWGAAWPQELVTVGR